MERAYTFVATINKESSDREGNHFVYNFESYYNQLRRSKNFVRGGDVQSKEKFTSKYLYIPESGFLEVNFCGIGGAETMCFLAVEKSTLINMAKDVGIAKIDDKCIRQILKIAGD